MKKEHIVNNVCIIRKKMNLTQENLANSVGVSRQTIISIEKGNYTPSVLLAIKIAHTLQKNIEELFFIKKNYK